jgi:hypothetical protein
MHPLSGLGASCADRHGLPIGEAEGEGILARGCKVPCLCVTASGFRLWCWKYRFAGTEKQLTLSSYPEILLANARQQRDEAAALLRTGAHPGIARKQKAAAIMAETQNTFEAIARRWHDTHKPR